MNRASQDRNREAAGTVCLRRVAVAGRLMLGDLAEPFEPIREANYIAKPRHGIKVELKVHHSFFTDRIDEVLPPELRRRAPSRLVATLRSYLYFILFVRRFETIRRG